MNPANPNNDGLNAEEHDVEAQEEHHQVGQAQLTSLFQEIGPITEENLQFLSRIINSQTLRNISTSTLNLAHNIATSDIATGLLHPNETLNTLVSMPSKKLVLPIGGGIGVGGFSSLIGGSSSNSADPNSVIKDMALGSAIGLAAGSLLILYPFNLKIPV